MTSLDFEYIQQLLWALGFVVVFLGLLIAPTAVYESYKRREYTRFRRTEMARQRWGEMMEQDAKPNIPTAVPNQAP